MNIRPIRDKVLIKPIEKEETTPGGIVMPENRLKGAVVEGEILAVGPEVKTVFPGQTVFFDKHSCTLRHVRFGDTKLLIMKEEDLVGYYYD